MATWVARTKKDWTFRREEIVRFVSSGRGNKEAIGRSDGDGKEETHDLDGKVHQGQEIIYPRRSQSSGGRQSHGIGGGGVEAEVHSAAAEEAQVELHHRRGCQMACKLTLFHLHLRQSWPHSDLTDLRGQVCPHGICWEQQVQSVVHATYRQMGRAFPLPFVGRMFGCH